MKTIFLAAGLSISLTSMAQAETLMMDKMEQQQAVQQQHPARGMSMNQVVARFGEPSEWLTPVGKPPITRWIYSEYTVYFEGSQVLHSVAHN